MYCLPSLLMIGPSLTLYLRQNARWKHVHQQSYSLLIRQKYVSQFSPTISQEAPPNPATEVVDGHPVIGTPIVILSIVISQQHYAAFR